MARLLWYGAIGITTPILLMVLVWSQIDPTPLKEVLLAIPVTFICSLVAYASVLAPWWLVLAIADGGLFPEIHEVELHGRSLRMGRKTFTLGHPREQISLTWTRHGTSLILRNPSEEFVVTGAHNAVAWVARHIEGLPTLGDADEVPVALRSLRQPGVAKE